MGAIAATSGAARSNENIERVCDLTRPTLNRLRSSVDVQPRAASSTCLDQRHIEDIVKNGSPDDVIVPCFGILRKQLACLMPHQWLNDQIVNFYFKLVEQHRCPKQGKRCWCPNSFFWLFLSGADENKYNYARVRRWSMRAKVDIFELDCVVFPVHVRGVHWATGAIDFLRKGFHYFDSLNQAPGRNFVPFLQRYLSDEHRNRKGTPLPQPASWKLLDLASPLPKQSNGFDCGIYACLYAEYFIAGRQIKFHDIDPREHRPRVVNRILQAGRIDAAPLYGAEKTGWI